VTTVSRTTSPSGMFGAWDYTSIMSVVRDLAAPAGQDAVHPGRHHRGDQGRPRAVLAAGRRPAGAGAFPPQDQVAQALPVTVMGADLAASTVNLDSGLTRYASETDRQLALGPIPSSNPDDLGLRLRPGVAALGLQRHRAFRRGRAADRLPDHRPAGRREPARPIRRSCGSTRSSPTGASPRRRPWTSGSPRPRQLWDDQHMTLRTTAVRAVVDRPPGPPVARPAPVGEPAAGAQRRAGRLLPPEPVDPRDAVADPGSDAGVAVPVVHRLQPVPGPEVGGAGQLRDHVRRPAPAAVGRGHDDLRGGLGTAEAGGGAGGGDAARPAAAQPGLLPLRPGRPRVSTG
jgi:hypothetical protein